MFHLILIRNFRLNYFHKWFKNQKFKVGMVMLDVFPRYTVVIPITRSGGDVASGLIEALNKFDKSPQMIYSDDEKALSTEADEKKKHSMD